MQPTPQVTALPDSELTLYVLLAGVLGGLLLALVVMVCCRVCLPKKKQLTRQHVVFSRSSEREARSSSNRARKYHSLDSSVSVDIESSWGQFSDSSPSPREPKEFSPEQVSQRHNAPSLPSPHHMSPRCLPDIPENKIPEEEKNAASDAQRKKAPEGRRRSSTGIQRQASVCLSDGEEEEAIFSPPQPHHPTAQHVPTHAKSPHAQPSHRKYHHHQVEDEEDDDLPASLNITQVSAVVHRSGTESSQPSSSSSPGLMGTMAAPAGAYGGGGSPDQLASGSRSSCRNSRSSQGSHSIHSSLDSGSTRTVIAGSIDAAFSNGDSQKVKEPETNLGLQASFHRRSCRLHSAVDLEEYSYARRQHRHSTGSLPLLRERSASSLDGEGWAEIPTPLREAGSTELGLLERGLEAHIRKRLGLRRPPDDDDDTDTVKRPVRYNDTGSREEIREDVSSSPEEEMDEEGGDEEGDDDTEDYERLRMEYRLLWQLRATLEEEEEFSDTLRLEDEDDDEDDDADLDGGSSDGAVTKESVEVAAVHSPPPPSKDQLSPEKEAVSSQTASFESSTAPLEDCGGVITEKVYSNLLSLPTADSRRSSYVSRASKRLKRSAPGSIEGQNSFDSSISTEWSSMDASRTSTSFESSTTTTTTTTDNTDSTAESQTRKLQQMKADSGYKSMESTERPPPPPPPGLVMIRLRGHRVTEGESIEEIDESLGVSIEDSLDIPESVSISAEEESSKDQPPVVITIVDEIIENKNKRALMQQIRRTTSAELEALTAASSGGDIPPEILGKMSVFQRFFRSSRPPRIERLIRDYSIDEKTDSLFREFSRQDPGIEADSQRAWSASWRQSHFRLHHHAHHPHHHLHRRIDQDDDLTSSGSKVLSPQLSIEEESDGESRLVHTSKKTDALRQSSDWGSTTAMLLQEIPVIRLPDED